MDSIAWEMIAPMIVAIVLIVTVGGVLVLRPLAKRVSELLDVYAREQRSGLHGEVGQLRDVLETMNARLQLMEERQDFTERLLADPKRGDRLSTDTTSGPGGQTTPKG